MTTTPTDKRASRSDRRRARADMRRIVPALVGFFVVEGTLDVFNPDGSASVWNLIWSLSPMVFVVWFVAATLKSVRCADEYQRRVHLESMAVGFGAMMVVAVASSLLDAGRVIHISSTGGYVLYAGTIAWVTTLWGKSMQAR
jgi:uncharacterized membrane protein